MSSPPMSLRSVIPYVWIGDGERHSLWGAAGAGRGEAEFLDGRLRTDISMEMVAVGYGYALSVSTLSFASLKADASIVRLEIEEGEGVSASRGEVGMVRVGGEVGRNWHDASGQQFRASVQGLVRHEGGDGADRTGAELGISMAWKPADSGIEFQVRGRYVDFFDGLRIVGGSVSGKVALGGSSGEGLSLALGSEWGDPDGGDEMWKSSLRELASDGSAAPVFRADTRYGFGSQGGWSRESYATLRRSSEERLGVGHPRRHAVRARHRPQHGKGGGRFLHRQGERCRDSIRGLSRLQRLGERTTPFDFRRLGGIGRRGSCGGCAPWNELRRRFRLLRTTATQRMHSCWDR